MFNKKNGKFLFVTLFVFSVFLLNPQITLAKTLNSEIAMTSNVNDNRGRKSKITLITLENIEDLKEIRENEASVNAVFCDSSLYSKIVKGKFLLNKVFKGYSGTFVLINTETVIGDLTPYKLKSNNAILVYQNGDLLSETYFYFDNIIKKDR